MDTLPKTYKVHIYAQATGPLRGYTENIMSFSLDSHVTNGLVLTYPGAKSRFATLSNGDPFISEGRTTFLTNAGKVVWTNLPVIIEEE